MNKIQALRQKLAALCSQQETIVNAALNDGRALVADETALLQNLQTQVDAMAATIQQAEAIEARSRELEEPANDPYRPSGTYAGASDPSQNNRKLDDGGFTSLGEMLAAVRFGDSSGRLKALATGDAGVLIPPAFSQNIMALEPEGEIVMPRATNIPAGDPPDGEFTIPYFEQGANGANGGISLTWTAEAQPIPEVTKPGIKDLTLKPQEVSGLATINNKTLQNWQAAGAFFQQLMRQAFVTGRDYKFLRGTGAGTPLGVLKAPGAIKINRKTANTVVLEDTANMLGRLLPEAMDGALWCASITLLPAIVQMADGNGRLIYMPGNVTQGIPATLLGIPVHWTGKTPVKGQEGDLMLCNCRYYLTKAGSGPFVALSEHVKFSTNQTVFRIVANIDGQPWVKDPLKLEDGATTVSPYVILK